MKSLALLAFICLACGSLRANTYGFLPGEKPQISMKEALGILEKHAKSVTGRDFNPRFTGLMGAGTPGAGAWDFMQAEKDGKVYKFIVYFPRDLCVVLDYSNTGFLGAFTRDGKKVDRKTAGFEPMEPEKNPFFDPAKDPSAESAAPKKQIDPKVRAETLETAARWVDAEKLAAFGEPAIGTVDPGKPVWRIFVDPSGYRPTLFKWINRGSPSAYLEVKQITRDGDHWKLVSKERVAITHLQEGILDRMPTEADLGTLPEKDWLGDKILGGTCWIYDFVSKDGSAVFARRAGAKPYKEEVYADAGGQRLARENSLAAVTMMICMISGIENPMP